MIYKKSTNLKLLVAKFPNFVKYRTYKVFFINLIEQVTFLIISKSLKANGNFGY